jgi:glycosyltransferase involved in cell wall biosynthesis
VFGIVEDERSDAYRTRIERVAGGDPRIAFHAPVPSHDVVSTLRRYDALVVPSQWLETGPLVVLEAFAARIPVIGSRLGGVAELVRDERDGVLVAHDQPGAWRDALERIAGNHALLETLRAGVRPPRTVAEVAEDMVRVYREVHPRDAAGDLTGEMAALSSAGGAS